MASSIDWLCLTNSTKPIKTFDFYWYETKKSKKWSYLRVWKQQWIIKVASHNFSQLIAVKCETDSFEHGIRKISFRTQLSRQDIFIQKQAKKNFNPIYYNSYIIIILIVHVDIVSYISSISSVISVICWTVSTNKTKNIIYMMKTPVGILTDALLLWHR